MTPRTPLLDFLNQEQVRLLWDAKDRNADDGDKRDAEVVLQRLVKLGRRLKPGPKRPGPPKQEATNSVDVELRRLIATIRARLGLDPRSSKDRTLQMLHLTVQKVHEILTNSLLLGEGELWILQSIQSPLAGHRPKTDAFCGALGRVVASFTSNGLGVAETLDRVVQEILEAPCSKKEDEKVLYVSVAQSLGFDGVPATAKKGRASGTCKGTKLRRQDVLSTAIARLSHFRYLFSGNYKLVPGPLFLELFERVRMGGGECPEAMDLYQGVLRLLVAAMERQGSHHPRHDSGIETPVAEPKIYSEGEVFVGEPRYREVIFRYNFVEAVVSQE